jgi:hypothetical protein
MLHRRGERDRKKNYPLFGFAFLMVNKTESSVSALKIILAVNDDLRPHSRPSRLLHRLAVAVQKRTSPK